VPQFRGVARWDLGDVGGLDDLRDALALGLERGLGFEASAAYINLAHFVWLTHGPAQALELERAAIEFAERRGMPGQVMWSQQEMLWFLFDLGEWEEVLTFAEDLIERDRARGGSQVGVSALVYKAEVLVRRGGADEAANLQRAFLPRGRDVGDPQVLGPALAVGALVEQARGELARAVRLIEELGELTRERNPWHRTRHLPDAARILVAAGIRDVDEIVSLDDAGVIGARPLTSLLTARAVIAEAFGDPEEAANPYRDAAERWAEYGFVLERGHALLGAGRSLVTLGRRQEATGVLRQARDVFAALRASPLVAQTDALLNQPATGSLSAG
jgi:tetratricopeptide (TPR) repeat protein